MAITAFVDGLAGSTLVCPVLGFTKRRNLSERLILTFSISIPFRLNLWDGAFIVRLIASRQYDATAALTSLVDTADVFATVVQKETSRFFGAMMTEVLRVKASRTFNLGWNRWLRMD